MLFAIGVVMWIHLVFPVVAVSVVVSGCGLGLF